MKRVNIHLDEETIKKLDAITKKCNGDNWRRTATRADLVRYAIAQTFGLKFPYIHYGAEKDIKDAMEPVKKAK